MRHALMIAFLVLQALLPLRYYMGDDLFDERFAWRMFSPIRTVKCRATFYDETGDRRARIPLTPRVHQVWINLVSRARRPVIDGIARDWCTEQIEGGTASPRMTVEITCPLKTGDTVQPIPNDENLCETAR